MTAVRLLDVTAAELGKLRTLPIVAATAVGTVVIGAAIAAALASGPDTPSSPVAVLLATLPFVQPGIAALGVLPVAHEYAGRQYRTTLTAVPDRMLLVVAKTLAALVATALTAAATVGACLAVAGGISGGPRPIAGAVAYLTLLGLLSHTVALLMRHLVPALVTMLGLVLIVSPLLRGHTEHARLLPDRAAAALYDASGAVLSGLMVTFAWIATIGTVAAVRFVQRDA